MGVVAGLGVGQPAQHRQALADGVAARAEPLVREGLPRGERRHGPAPRLASSAACEVLGLATGGGHGEDRRPGAGRRERGDDQVPGAGRCGGDDLRRGDGEGLPRRAVPGRAATWARRADRDGISRSLVAGRAYSRLGGGRAEPCPGGLA